MKPVTMWCQLCGDTHEYKNPKQFQTWAGRHRKAKHQRHKGTISFKPQPPAHLLSPVRR